jgi:hypothetical protein
MDFVTKVLDVLKSADSLKIMIALCLASMAILFVPALALPEHRHWAVGVMAVSGSWVIVSVSDKVWKAIRKARDKQRMAKALNDLTQDELAVVYSFLDRRAQFVRVAELHKIERLFGRGILNRPRSETRWGPLGPGEDPLSAEVTMAPWAWEHITRNPRS